MSDQNKDYSWQWLDKLLDEFGLKYEWPFGYMHDGDRSPADQQHEARAELRAEALATIIARIDEHYIGKGETSESLRAVFAAQLRAADADRHTFKGDAQAWIAVTADCMASTAESEVEQRCIAARLAENKENLAGFTNLAREDFYRKDWLVDYFKARDDQLKRQLSTNSKDTLERSSDDKK